MAISKDLLLSVLAMDAYNRGYNEGIIDTGTSQTAVGTAQLLEESITESDSAEVAAGFYAVAYDVATTDAAGNPVSETVISYRGTDDIGFIPDLWSDDPGCKLAEALRRP